MVKWSKKPTVASNDKGLEPTRPTLSALRQDSDLGTGFRSYSTT